MNLRLLAMLLGVFAIITFTACGDDEGSTATNPSVSCDSGITEVLADAEGTVTFTVADADGESYSATGSGVTVSNGSGTVSGTSVEIAYTAGSTEGAASVTLTVGSASCTAVFNVVGEITTIRVSDNIDADATWEAGKCYILGGRITVLDGATLTIEPGTLIKGEAGTGPNATALLVARGGKLMAEGTAEAPIIFTTVADEITPEDIAAGNFGSPNLDPDANGYWGGVIVLGKARISASADEVQIEGIPVTDTNGLYGGDQDDDNSGVISHISIRHGGSNIGAGNEINGLTLGGVGSGTTINNVEVVANQDDGIEWFGGTVSVSDVVVWNAGDDALDTDQAWSGTCSNFVVVTPSGSCFELDGPEGTYEARHAFDKGTVVAITEARITGGSLIDTDSGTPVDISNVHFVAPLSFVNDDDETIYLTITNDEFDLTTFENVTFDVDDIVNVMEKPGDPVPAGVATGGSSQADVSVLGWTWAGKAGGLDGL
jgi:hypothetical protein